MGNFLSRIKEAKETHELFYILVPIWNFISSEYKINISSFCYLLISLGGFIVIYIFVLYKRIQKPPDFIKIIASLERTDSKEDCHKRFIRNWKKLKCKSGNSLIMELIKIHEKYGHHCFDFKNYSPDSDIISMKENYEAYREEINNYKNKIRLD